VSVKSVDPAVIYLVKNSVGTSDYLVFNPLPNDSAFNFAQYSDRKSKRLNSLHDALPIP